jgi:hypothetical protein
MKIAFTRSYPQNITEVMSTVKKVLSAIALVVLLFSMQSCVEIVEEIVVNDNGSGTMSLSAGLSGTNSLMGLISSFANIAPLADIEGEVEFFVSKLKAQEGISNVRFSKIKSGGNYALSFDFKDSKSLNKALYAVSNQEKKFYQPSFYKISKNKYQRKNITNWANMLLEKEKDNLPDEAIFELMTYKAVVNVPRPATRVKADDAKVSKNQKTISTKNFISDILDDRIDTGMKVKF